MSSLMIESMIVPRCRMWSWLRDRSLPNRWCLCPDPTRAGRTAVPGPERPSAAWSAGSAPWPAGPERVRRDSRRFSHPLDIRYYFISWHYQKLYIEISIILDFKIVEIHWQNLIWMIKMNVKGVDTVKVNRERQEM